MFDDYDAPLSDRRNIIVMSDEAHRGQYGFEEKVNSETGKISVGTARLIHDSLPHASSIGFTGTPVALKDRNTIEVFGDCIDVYDMTQSVLDHANVPVYYEGRVVNFALDDETLQLIDKEYEVLEAEGEDAVQVEKSKHDLSHLEELLGADSTPKCKSYNIGRFFYGLYVLEREDSVTLEKVKKREFYIRKMVKRSRIVTFLSSNSR